MAPILPIINAKVAATTPTASKYLIEIKRTIKITTTSAIVAQVIGLVYLDSTNTALWKLINTDSPGLNIIIINGIFEKWDSSIDKPDTVLNQKYDKGEMNEILEGTIETYGDLLKRVRKTIDRKK